MPRRASASRSSRSRSSLTVDVLAEVLAHRRPGPGQPGGDRAGRDVEEPRRRLVVESLAVDHHDGDALVVGQGGQRSPGGVGGDDGPLGAGARWVRSHVASVMSTGAGRRFERRSSSMQAL